MMEGENEGLGEGQGIFKDKEPRIKKGVSAGRVVNALLTLNYFLILLTALIVTGIFGVLNHKVCMLPRTQISFLQELAIAM